MLMAELAWSWAKIGLFGFGGGNAMIPLIQAECVEQRAWVTEAEFIEALAASSALPGPITTKLSIYIGLQTGGVMGAIVSLVAVIAPAAVFMGLGAGLVLRYRASPAVAGALTAIKPVVVGMVAWSLVTLFDTGVQGWISGLVAVVALVALLLKVHPVAVIAVALVGGALFVR